MDRHEKDKEAIPNTGSKERDLDSNNDGYIFAIAPKPRSTELIEQVPDISATPAFQYIDEVGWSFYLSLIPWQQECFCSAFSM